MPNLKCLACGHDNEAGDDFCAACSSSLRLKLCGGCEAINAERAGRCHSCGTAFLVEAYEALPALLPAARGAPRKKSFAATLLTLPLAAAAGAGYYFYGTSQAGQMDAVPLQVIEVKQAPAPVVPVVEVKQAPAAQPKLPAASVTHTRAGAAAPTPVTHTRAFAEPGMNPAKEQPAACAPGVAALGLCAGK